MILNPRIIFSSGIPSAGKTSTLKGIAKKVHNSFYIDRDDIIWGLLHVAKTKTNELPDFEEYVAKDTVFPNNAQYIEDFAFGEMIKVNPLNSYNRRHGRDQTYLIQFRLARTGLELGKIPILDCFLPRQINDGTMKKILDYPDFKDYQKFMIHFTASEETCWQRSVERVKKNQEEAVRYKPIIGNGRRSFAEQYANKFKPEQGKLEEIGKLYNLLIMDTSGKTMEEASRECINFISQE